MNTIVISKDGEWVTLTNPERPGWKAEIKSRRPGGFTEGDLEHAKTYQPPEGMVVGQRTESRRFTVGPLAVYAHFLTGPPTWWLPKVKAGVGRRTHFLIGWFRMAAGLSVAWERVAK